MNQNVYCLTKARPPCMTNIFILSFAAFTKIDSKCYAGNEKIGVKETVVKVSDRDAGSLACSLTRET